MGHSSVKVTEMYAHLADERVRDIGTEMQAAWTTRHAVVTGSGIPREKPGKKGPSKSPVVRSSRTGRAR
jgi:hypothetical protein